MADQDERGRFVKGNKYRITSAEQQRQMMSKGGKRSQEVQKERKLWREELTSALLKTITSKTTGETLTKNRIAMEQLANKCAAGDLKAIKVAARILGEDTLKVDIQNAPPVILEPIPQDD